ncbi:MAG: sugar transferase [Chloroflexi bacterium]|nr:sugar transferase [Chloroflexota bacterium]
MLRRTSENYIIFLLASDLGLTLFSLYLSTQIRLALPFGTPLPPRAVSLDPPLYGLVFVIWLLAFLGFSVYDREKTLRAVDELQRVSVAVLAATLLFAGALYLTFREVSRLLFVYFFLIDLSALLLFRSLLRLVWRALGRPPQAWRRIIIVGAGNVGQELAQRLKGHGWAGIKLVGFLDDALDKVGREFESLPVLATLPDATKIIQEQKIDDVIFALPLHAHQEMVNAVAQFQRMPVRIYVVPDLFDLAFHRTTIEDLGGIPLVGLRDPVISGVQRVVKRLFDLVVAGLLLLLLSPFLLLLIALIRLDSPGAAIFKQQRVGEGGKLFWMYKFRTMVQDAEARMGEVLQVTEDQQILHKTKEDPRVTPMGRFLRRASLDELPQLLNVLKGEMSLVGPRPELPFMVDRYQPWQWKRFSVPQGLTGWWQVSGRSDKPMHLHTEDDLWYIQNYSLLLDIQILWKTIGAVIKGRGAF